MRSIIVNPIFSLSLIVVILILIVVLLFTIMYIKKNYANQCQDIEVPKDYARLQEIKGKLIECCTQISKLGEDNKEPNVRLSEFQQIMINQFPWTKAVNQKRTMMLLFNDIEQILESTLVNEDKVKIEKMQHMIFDFRKNLSCYNYPLNDAEKNKLRVDFARMIMIVMDVVESLGEAPNYYEQYQGYNVAKLLEREVDDRRLHEVTTVEDNQERWALIMKALLDNLCLSDDMSLILYSYRYK